MPKGVQGFQKGNSFGGYREKAGRLTKEEEQERLTLIQWLEREKQRRAKQIAKRYYDMAHNDPPTMRHVIDGERLNNGLQQSSTTTYQFIQFTNNQNTLQLPAEGISAPILVSDGRGEEESSKVLASSVGEGQDGLKFHSFAHVPRKPR